MTDPLGSQDLSAFMQRHNIPGELIELKTPTPTVQSAADAVGVQPEQIVKSILFKVKGISLVLAVACGPAHIRRRAIAAHFEVGRKKVKLADADTVLQESGFEVGAMPPFGHRQPFTTLLDNQVLEQPEVYAGGGSLNTLLRLDPQDILKHTKAALLDLLAIPQK